MARTRSSRVFSIKFFTIFFIVSVLYIQTTQSAPASLDDSEDISSRLQNPCNYNLLTTHRHKRSQKNQQRNLIHVQAELKKVRKLASKTLKMFQKIYQHSTTLKWPYELVPKNLTSRIEAYHGLQAFMKAIDLMSKQSFKIIGELSPDNRSLSLKALLNKSTVLLCEIYDDIHSHNQTKDVLKPEDNQNVVTVKSKIPASIERGSMSTQDREVLKKFKKFLKDLCQFYRKEKKHQQKKTGGDSKKGNKSSNKNNKTASKEIYPKRHQQGKSLKALQQKQKKKHVKRRANC